MLKGGIDYLLCCIEQEQIDGSTQSMFFNSIIQPLHEGTRSHSENISASKFKRASVTNTSPGKNIRETVEGNMASEDW